MNRGRATVSRCAQPCWRSGTQVPGDGRRHKWLSTHVHHERMVRDAGSGIAGSAKATLKLHRANMPSGQAPAGAAGRRVAAWRSWPHDTHPPVRPVAARYILFKRCLCWAAMVR